MDAAAGPFFKTVSSTALRRVSLEDASGWPTFRQPGTAHFGGQ
jgi:hypothetical protein